MSRLRDRPKPADTCAGLRCRRSSVRRFGGQLYCDSCYLELLNFLVKHSKKRSA